MAHLRRTIRDMVIPALVTAVPAAGGRVTGVRPYGHTAGALPAIEVSTPADAWQRAGLRDGWQRDVTLAVTVVHAVTDDVENALDAIAEAVEAAIFALSGLTVLAFSTEFEAGDPGAKIPAVLRLTYTLRLLSRATAPQVL